MEASDLLKMQYEALPDTERQAIRDEVGQFAQHFIHDGVLTIPHSFLVAQGTK